MMLQGWRNARAILLGVPVVVMTAMVGCTGSEVIPTGDGTFIVEVATEGDAGRYDVASFQIAEVFLRPLDPTWDATLKGYGLGTLRAAITVDLNQTANSVWATNPLRAGRYRVENLKLAAFILEDLDGPVDPATTCVEAVDTCPATTRPGPTDPPDFCLTTVASAKQQPSAVEVTGFDPEVIVEISPGQETTLRLVISVPELVAMLEGSFECRDTTQCNYTVIHVTVNPPCLQSFAVPTSDDFRQVLRFE